MAVTESVLIATIIDVKEGRDVAVIDAPGAFLTDDMDEDVIVVLENEMVAAMLKIDKDVYGKYVIHGNNEKNTCTFTSVRRCTDHSRQNSYTIGKF